MRDLELSTIRRFVLGDLDEDTRRTIEAEAVGNDELFERIEAVEDEIVEEYLSGELPLSERKIFEETLDSIPGRRRRVAMVSALAAHKASATDESTVVNIREHARFANHSRFAIAAGFAAAAITAVAFFQFKQANTSATPKTPIAAIPPAPATSGSLAAPTAITPETSSALTAHRPATPLLAARKPQPPNVSSTPVVTFLLVATTVRSEASAATLTLDKPESVVEFQIAIDDDEFSHYNAELRAPDGTTVSSHRDIPVSALAGAPVVRLSVPAAALGAGRHELVLAGVHERGTEEVAYLEFDIVKR